MTSNQHLIALLATSLTTFLIGVFIYLRNKKVRVNRIFALYSCSIAIWSLGQGLHSIAPNIKVCLFWARFSHVGVVFVPTLFLHFVFEFLNITRERKTHLIACYLLSSFFLFMNLFTSLYIPNAVPKFSLKYYIEPGFFYPFSVVFFIICVVYGLYELFKALIISTGIRRNQLKYLCWSSLFGYLGGSLNFLFVFDKYIYPLNPFATYFVPLYVFVTVYAIVKYNLISIDVAAKELLAKMVSFSILTSTAYLTVMVYLRLFKIPVMPIIIVPSLITMILFYSFYKKFSSIISHTIRPRPDFQAILKDYTEIDIMTQHTSKGLAELVIKRIADSIRSTVSSLMFRDKTSGLFNIIASSGKDEEIKTIAFKQGNHLILAVKRYPHTRVIVKDELDKVFTQDVVGLIRRDLEILKSEISIPIKLHGELLGFLNLGTKTSGELYTPDEIGFLLIFVTQSAFMMQFLDKIQKVHELEVKAEKLAGMTNLLDGLNHEFRNQLSTLQFYFITAKDFGSKEDIESYSQLAKASMEAILMILDAVEDYRDTSEITSITQMDIRQLIETPLSKLKSKFEEKKIKISSKIADNLPRIEAYPSFKNLFFNLFTNSYYALSQRKLRRLEIKVTLVKNPSRPLEIIIKDTGGDMLKVMEEHAQSSGGEYFPERANIGGINFFLAKHIIEDHKGELLVSANPTKDPAEEDGTTFTIRLPLVQKRK